MILRQKAYFSPDYWKAMDLTFNLAPSYQDLKGPTSCQNFYDTPGQIPKLILTLCLRVWILVPFKSFKSGIVCIKYKL